jgi:serine O-acetyltransferase
MVGAGAQVLGDIVIGARSVVGANAVVVHSAPADSVIVGIPGVARPRSDAQTPAQREAERDEAWLDPAIYI